MKSYTQMVNTTELAMATGVKGIVFGFFGLLTVGTFKLLSKLMPLTAKLFKNHIISEINKEPLKSIRHLESKLEKYKQEKHKIQNDRISLEEVILSGDEELLEEVKRIIKKKRNEEK
jgi:hypothetical protein